MKQNINQATKVSSKNFSIFCLFAFFITANHAVFAAETATYYDPGIRIGIIGDQTGTADLNAAYGIMERGVQALSQQAPDVVIHVGDLLESRESEADIRNQFTQASAILDRLPARWYMTAGDHDVNPPAFQQDSSDRSREALFQELYGARVPAVLKHPYYSFNAGDYHFVALYSHEALHADPRWGNIFLAEVSDAQYQWLAQDLEYNKTAKAIVVFIHQPLWYNWSAWQRVHNLLKRYPVAVVVAGHFHYDQREGIIDGIRYGVVGATGGTVKQGDRDAGNVHHVSVLTVKSKSEVSVELISVSDNLPLKPTPRVDMDKIQAMDIVLGELWNFASTNPVFVKDGQLVNACDSTEPAKIQITPVGNPTDDSMDVKIAFSSDDANVGLTSPGFVSGQCESVISPYECVLARSARIFVANYSSVTVNTFAGPLWETTLGVAGSQPPQAGAGLHFDIRLEYGGQSGNLGLERRATTTIQACP